VLVDEFGSLINNRSEEAILISKGNKKARLNVTGFKFAV
jgi:hypothetical protein